MCSYLARVLPAFGRDRELSLLVDREGEARLKAKQIEIAERIREKMGIDVFVDTELRVTAFEKMLVEFVKSGQWGDGSGQDE